jgi:hypothetical protein
MSLDRVKELITYGCKEPEWFLRDHIPRYAQHYGVGFEAAYQAVLEEHVALTEVRNENFQQMLDTGVARTMLDIYAKQGKLRDIGERPLIVMDRYAYMMKRNKPDEPYSSNTTYTYYDPICPLLIRNFSVMSDPVDTRCLEPIVIGRPNTDGELWLDEGITVEDDDVVSDCFKRLIELRVEGRTPHLQDSLDHIFIPYTLGDPEKPFNPADFHHDPVEYSGIASGLKVAA